MKNLNHKYPNTFFGVLIVVLILVALIAIRYGAVAISLDEMASSSYKFWVSHEELTLNERIFMDIRLPRALLCVVVGASLAVGGTLMQALFRNPIVEPGLVGTSSGAALGAAFYFVLGATFQLSTNDWTLPLAACLGATLATVLVFLLAQNKDNNRSSVVMLLLTGIAINALCMSGVGFLSYIARDPQARSITFWGMGTLSGANWQSVGVVALSTTICVGVALRYAKDLNALLIGEEEAVFLGVNLRKLKWIILGVNVVMIAVATSFVGVIGFVGLIVPHLLRMLGGADNRLLLRNSTVLGAIFLTLADFTARMLLRPAELPIGIVTSMVGVPVFVFLLRRKGYYF